MDIANRNDRGFTLIEVIAAVGLLSVAVVGVAGLFLLAENTVEIARRHTVATILAADKIEQLRGLAWLYGDDGAPVSDVTTDVGAEPATEFGLGLSVSPPDALTRSAPGYVDYLDEAGRWVGNGAQPSPAAVFVRRWSVRPLLADPVNTLVLQVLVLSVVDLPHAVFGHGVGPPGAASIVALKTRIAS